MTCNLNSIIDINYEHGNFFICKILYQIFAWWWFLSWSDKNIFVLKRLGRITRAKKLWNLYSLCKISTHINLSSITKQNTKNRGSQKNRTKPTYPVCYMIRAHEINFSVCCSKLFVRNTFVIYSCGSYNFCCISWRMW